MRKTLLLALLVAAAACAAPRTLRDAQDAFNRAAETENRARLADGWDAVTPAAPRARPEVFSTADADYRAALGILRGIGAEEEASLRADGLWVQKLTLEALCHWKLEEHEQAIAVAQQARGQADGVADQRDRALLIALPGLVINDQTRARIPRTPSTAPDRAERFEAIRDDLTDPATGAIAHLREARGAAEDHPVDVYLIQCSLAVFKNLADAYGNLTVRGFSDAENDAVAALLNDYEAAFRAAFRLPAEPLRSFPARDAWLAQFPALVYDVEIGKVVRR